MRRGIIKATVHIEGARKIIKSSQVDWHSRGEAVVVEGASVHVSVCVGVDVGASIL